ncbi:E3 ubiquitin-protein ligase synoviolin [Frankliniella fusca]|uniref:RING-type E3 ubiquitin transferase n=1 Tax=Frankliniella fusca TaxID=407009 RepID=A0AAE1HJ07_9NEOP|nr:E3 ubiquitin-protein ligase synoviolin [Frankliniella fusca]
MRAASITFISLALTTAVVGNAFYLKKQFYPSVVYITKSNPSMAVIYIQALVVVVLIGKLMQKVFFGQLRAAEFEHLADRSWYAVTETCLAFTLFRDDFAPRFVAQFILLLFLKAFHWLAEDRVDFMERSPIISWLFHLRVISLMFVLSLLDLYFVNHAYLSTVSGGASAQIVFGFEYMILLMIVLNIAIKYVLHTIDLNSDNPWDNKAVFLLYTEVVMGMFKVVLYVTFLIIMVRIFTLPLFLFRPMYYTLRSFRKAINDVILSRRAIRNMNTLYPDATPEELSAADNVCIICREEMHSASKKLPCNHIFHTSCLRSWFQRQQTCPTCRLNILRIPGDRNTAANQAANAEGQAQHAPDVPPVPHPGLPNPFLNGVFPGMFPFWQQQFNLQPPNQLPNQAPPPTGQPGQSTQTNPAGQASTSVTAGATTGTAPGVQPGPNVMPVPPFPPMPPGFGLPFFCPPFPPAPPPFAVPPPMPPPGLATLSDEELRRLESAARDGVAARLQCLQNIQQLLDAAVLLMQQYSNAAATASAASVTSVPQPPPSSSTSPDTGTGVATTPTPTTSTTPSPHVTVTSNTTQNVAQAEEKQPSVSLSPGSPSSSRSNEEKGNSSGLTHSIRPDGSGPSSSSNQTVTSAPSPEQDEIRRRRLQKFSGIPESLD